jgi:hypothetical protein
VSVLLESSAVHTTVVPGVPAAVLQRWDLRSLIEFVLQLSLESHKVLAPLSNLYPCLDRVVTEPPC